MPSRRIVVRVPSGRMRVYSVYETLPGTVSTERDIPDRSSCFTCHPERSEGSLPQRCFTLFSMTVISTSPLICPRLSRFRSFSFRVPVLALPFKSTKLPDFVLSTLFFTFKSMKSPDFVLSTGSGDYMCSTSGCSSTPNLALTDAMMRFSSPTISSGYASPVWFTITSGCLSHTAAPPLRFPFHPHCSIIHAAGILTSGSGEDPSLRSG